MKSKILSIRLKDPVEFDMLDKICKSKETGDKARGDMIRVLIHREYNRRTTGKSVIKNESALLGENRRGSKI